MFFVIDGKYSETGYDLFSDHTLIFSPNSKKIAYAMGTKNKFKVFVNGEVFGEGYDGIPNNYWKAIFQS